MSELKSVTARDAIISREAKSRRTKLYGTPRPLLPERKVSFMTGKVIDVPHFVYD